MALKSEVPRTRAPTRLCKNSAGGRVHRAELYCQFSSGEVVAPVMNDALGKITKRILVETVGVGK